MRQAARVGRRRGAAEKACLRPETITRHVSWLVNTDWSQARKSLAKASLRLCKAPLASNLGVQSEKSMRKPIITCGSSQARLKRSPLLSQLCGKP